MAILQSTTVTGSLIISGSQENLVQIIGSGSTLFAVNGASGQLFGVSDDLTDSLFSVNTIAGLPVIEAFADNTVKIGTYGSEELIVSSSQVYITSASLSGPTLFLDGNVGIGTATPAANAKITNMGNMTFGIPGNGSNTSGRFISIEGNTDAGGEGSGRIFFTEHNSSTAGMSNYGMSIGYRGGGTSIVGADGNTWTGLASIDNGEWGMWGHNNNATGALIMYGPRSGASITVAGNLIVNNNVGIGDSTPDFALQVATPEETTDPISFAFDITRENSGIRGMTFGMAIDDSYGAIGTHNADLQLGHTFGTESNGQPAFYPTLTIQHIDESVGNVGIGTITPSSTLHVNGPDTNDHTPTVYLKNNGGNGGEGDVLDVETARGDGASDSYIARFRNSVSTKLYIQGDGNVGIGTTSPSEKLHVQGNITSSGNLTLEGNAGYPIFESGFGGSGWRVDSSANAEFQNLTVRGTFSVYELLAQQIRATNGSLLVATSGKVESTGSLTLFFDTGSQYGHGFLPGDILLAQRLDPGGGQLKRTFLTVNTVSSTGSLTYKDLSGNPPEAGQEFVRIGSTSSLDRQGHIYLTADDSNAPYIGVRDGVSGSTQFTSGTGSIEKVRMGKLSGITSNTFGALSGYGFWAKGNAYLEGGISATFGDIGGFNITDSAITSSGDLLSLKSNGQITASNALIGGTSKIAGFTVSDTQINSGTNLVLKSSGQITGSNVLFTGGKISGSSLAIDVTTLTAKGNTVEISGSNFHLLNGNITASNVNLSGNISATTGNIGGFAITSDAITGSGFYLSGSATGNEFFISSSNFNVKANGDVTGSSVLFDGGKIGGFDITSDKLSITSGDFEILQGSLFSNNIGYRVVETTGGSRQINMRYDTADDSLEFLIYKDTNNYFNVGDAYADQYTGWGLNLRVDGEDILKVENDIVTLSGFTATKDAFAGDNFYISGSATGNEFFISSSNFNVKANGDLTGSSVLLDGGEIGGFTISETFISSSGLTLLGTGTITAGSGTNRAALSAAHPYYRFWAGATDAGSPGSAGAPFRVRNTGVLEATGAIITGSINATSGNFTGNISATTGNIGGFAITDSAITGSGFYLSGSATGTQFFISASNFNVKANGQLTASAALIGGTSKIAGFTVSSTQINDSSGTNLILKSNGQITASAAFIEGRINANSGVFNGVNIQEASISDILEIDGGGKITNPVEDFIISGSGIFLKSGTSSQTSGNTLPNSINFLNNNGTFSHQIRGGDPAAQDLHIESVSGSVNIRSYASASPGGGEGVNISTTNGNIELQSPTDIQDQLTVSGNVGIGAATPSAKLHISGSNDVLLVEGSGSTLFDIQGSQGQLFSVTDDLTGTLFSVNDISGIPILSVDSDDTVTMGTFGANTLVVTGSLVGIGTTSPAEKLTVAGNIKLSGNVIPANGQGIDFTADGNASGMDSELLDDYEEGEWTPEYDSSIASPTGTITYDSGVTFGRYTKIGNKVTAWGRIRTDRFLFDDSNGAVYVHGFPFVPSAILGTGTVTYSAAISRTENFAGDDPWFAGLASNQDRMYLYYKTTFNGTTTNINPTDFAQGISSDRHDLAFTITYQTDS